MSGRINNRWTPELLEQCRRLYEQGAGNQALGAMFGIKPSTIAVMAWQRDWRREQRAAPAGTTAALNRLAGTGGIGNDLNPPIPPSRDELALNTRLCRIISAYWRGQGKSIDVRVETLGCGIQCIRSRSRGRFCSTWRKKWIKAIIDPCVATSPRSYERYPIPGGGCT